MNDRPRLPLFTDGSRTLAATSVAFWLAQAGVWAAAISMGSSHKRGALLWFVLGVPPVILAVVAARGFARRGLTGRKRIFLVLATVGTVLTIAFAFEQYTVVGPDSMRVH